MIEGNPGFEHNPYILTFTFRFPLKKPGISLKKSATNLLGFKTRVRSRWIFYQISWYHPWNWYIYLYEQLLNFHGSYEIYCSISSVWMTRISRFGASSSQRNSTDKSDFFAEDFVCPQHFRRLGGLIEGALSFIIVLFWWWLKHGFSPIHLFKHMRFCQKW